MSAWLDTHNLFIAGIGAAVLAGQGCDVVAGSRHQARELVAAIGEAFDAVQSRGQAVRPGSLRAIFGRVPLALAAHYWQRQFAGPTVRVSIAPHVLATRHSEFPQVVDRALDLVGSAAPRYRRLVGPYAASRSGP